MKGGLPVLEEAAGGRLRRPRRGRPLAFERERRFVCLGLAGDGRLDDGHHLRVFVVLLARLSLVLLRLVVLVFGRRLLDASLAAAPARPRRLRLLLLLRPVHTRAAGDLGARVALEEEGRRRL